MFLYGNISPLFDNIFKDPFFLNKSIFSEWDAYD